MQLRGVRPFFSNKFNIEKHDNYPYLKDYNEKNAFDIQKYMSAQRNKNHIKGIKPTDKTTVIAEYDGTKDN